MKYLIPSILAASIVSMPAMAEKASSKPLLEKNQFSIGLGIANNSIDLPPAFGGDQDETGFQFFAAYDLNKVNLMDGVNTSLELGYMDYGDFGGGNSGGIWVNGVVDGTLSGKLGWLARVGLDLGDDDGLMLGAGLGVGLNDRMKLRFEYVVRDNIDSLQLNFIHRL
ncbi:MAG TPA: outer membrane beta-barrel protein [Gammaproteobacteria bacterium]